MAIAGAHGRWRRPETGPVRFIGREYNEDDSTDSYLYEVSISRPMVPSGFNS